MNNQHQNPNNIEVAGDQPGRQDQQTPGRQNEQPGRQDQPGRQQPGREDQSRDPMRNK